MLPLQAVQFVLALLYVHNILYYPSSTLHAATTYFKLKERKMMLTMITKMFALMTMALVTTHRIHAFSTPTSRISLSQGTMRINTALQEQQQQQQNNDQERRGFFSTVKRFLGASILVGVGGSKPLPVFAEETDTSPSGNIIEIQVNNLEGDPEKTGTIKIQMKPEWAPRGVARFEVSSHLYICFCVCMFVFVVIYKNNNVTFALTLTIL
ncbi:MAG: hypothetical protein ACI8RD_006832 [Bacillariaceae sp.]